MFQEQIEIALIHYVQDYNIDIDLLNAKDMN